MRRSRLAFIVAYIIFFGFFVLYFSFNSKDQIPLRSGVEKEVDDHDSETEVSRIESNYVEPIFASPLIIPFDDEEILQETGDARETKSHFWWLSSGGMFIVDGGVGNTVRGELAEDDYWRNLYNKNNPRDTDNGYHPQNIFRLVARSRWINFQQETYFRIIRDNLSGSRYRNASNGLLHFNRYQDSDNLYYTGIRVDGFAVIKKKIKGKYFTLAYNQVYPGKYDREKNPNLLPHDQWIGLRSEVTNGENGSVNIRLYLDRERNGNWELVAEAVDEGKKYGKSPFFDAGHGGIRTDFMDVEFDDYRIEEIN